jgi:cell division septal protein FtsQ
MIRFILFILTSFLIAQVPPSFTLKEVNVEGNEATSDNMILYTSGLKNE